jgi:hypothetical protein
LVGTLASAQRGALGVSHERGLIRFCGDLLGGSGLVCVCVAFERRKGGIFGLIGTRNGLPRHQVSTLAIDESLSLCEGREMDGKSNLIDWLYRALFYLIG